MNPPRQPSFREEIPDGDTQRRLVCTECGWIHYDNPKIVVGTVSIWEQRILLCRRAIPPRQGYWTIPAGYLEQGETPEEGALRETLEEACAHVQIRGLLSVYTVAPISQVQLIYAATMPSSHHEAGLESLESGLFEWDAIPWDEIAFPTVVWALRHHRRLGDARPVNPFTNPEAAEGSPA